MDTTKLKGEIRLEHSAKKNEYYAYDENGFVCGSLGVNKDKMQEMIDRSNKYVSVVSYLEKLETFEAELIQCDKVWSTSDGLPKITQEFYDKWIELQNERNELLGRGLGKARRSAELLEEVRIYKCIKGFSLEKCDDDGFTIDGEHMTIEEGDIWEVEEGSFRVIGGEVRLTNDEYGWLEITKDTLEEHFEVVEG